MSSQMACKKSPPTTAGKAWAAPKSKTQPKPKPTAVQREPRELPYRTALLLTVTDAAGLLNLSERKVYYLLARGELAKIRIDKSTRIRRTVVEAYIAMREQASA